MYNIYKETINFDYCLLIFGCFFQFFKKDCLKER